MNSRHLRKAVSLALGIVVVMFLLGTIGCTSLKPGADLRGADLSGRKLAGKDLRDADLSGATLVGADLAEAVLRNANLSSADLSDANLGAADLSEADLGDAILAGARLAGARLRGANLTGAVLPPSLRESDFAGAVFKNADLAGADLSNLDLSSLNLEGARLTGAALRDSDLSHANLVGADLRGADLSNADLTRADLSGVDLSNSNLTGARLGGADLTGADLSSANLSMANLELAAGLSEDGLSKAISQQALLGYTWLFALFSEACRGRPIPGATDLEPVLSGSDYFLLHEDGTGQYGEWRLVNSIGSIRYVVCIEEVTVTLESCRYIPLGDVDVERIDAKVRIVDIGTGEAIASELLRGEDPAVDYCPDSICVGDSCGSTTARGDLRGDGVPDEQMHEFVRTSVDAYEAQAPE